jgi:sigma-B regulation protein RsbU (phosphoserine phosphatase)
MFQRLGRVGVAFLVLLAGYVALAWIRPGSLIRFAFGLGLLITGVWLAVRLLRGAVWGLRNRLLVTYLFIAVVPILLILAAVGNAAYLLASQTVVYLATSEFDRRIQGLQTGADSILHTPPPDREDHMTRMAELFYRARYPGLEILVRQSGHSFRYPKDSQLPAPASGWKAVRGVLVRDGRLFLWCYQKTESGDITLSMPLTRQFLAELVPNLGPVDFAEPLTGRGRFSGLFLGNRLPPQKNRFDVVLTWNAAVPTWDWDHPNRESQGRMQVRSRPSALAATLFNNRSDSEQGLLVASLVATLAILLIVEIVSVVIGVRLTRTMTGAVHRLYEGTERVIAGDFSHRIEVAGKDQLAELSRSFNQMTDNTQRLLVVAKEKERLQSEIEIAREVQNQLYPRAVPASRTLRLAAVCQPARMVSGDYYDYETMRETQVALAIGDVAGKGISAALLMATLQSSLRTQLQSWLEASGNGAKPPAVSPARVVSLLNRQLYSYTSSEKFATFCLGIYDEPSGAFTYTNAGHLPPLLVRGGVPQRLDVNGTVIGAFAFSEYGESRVDMQPGDLLALFTDGITEPENEYGEMFGESRVIDLIVRNRHLKEEKIIELVLTSVRQWTASEELQDDMTILLARRV